MATLLSKFADSFDDETEKDAITDFINFCAAEDPAVAFDDLLVKTENEVSDMFVAILETGTGSYDNLKDYLVDKLVEDVNAVVGTCESQDDLEIKINSLTNGIDYTGLLTHLIGLNVITSVNDLKDAGSEMKADVLEALQSIPCSNTYTKSLANFIIDNVQRFDETIHQSFELSFQFKPDESTIRNTPSKVKIIDTGETPDVVVGEQALDSNNYIGFTLNKRKPFDTGTGIFSDVESCTLQFEVYNADDVLIFDTGSDAYDLPSTVDVVEIEYTPISPIFDIDFSGFSSEELSDNLGITSTSADILLTNDSYIDSLNDIRLTGGIFNVDSGGVETISDADKAILDKIAQLDLLYLEIFEPTPDEDVNDQKAKLLNKWKFLSELISLEDLDNKYKSIHDIAITPRSEFVVDVSGITDPEFGEANTIAMHTQAVIIDNANNNLALSLTVDNANGIAPQAAVAGSPSATSPVRYNTGFKSLLSDKCDCNECETSISPLAYLSALLSYSEKNLRFGSNVANLGYLTTTFKQGFALLPASCEEMDKVVCQQRIVIEILRNYYIDIFDPENSYKATSLRLQLFKIAKQVYYDFLKGIGTSYDEIRTFSTLNDLDKVRLANRIGVIETDIEDLFDISFSVGDIYDDEDHLLTLALFARLEEVLGFVDFTRDEFSTGLKLSDENNYLYRYILRNSVWNRTTDKKGYTYANITYTGTKKIELFRSSLLEESRKVAEASLEEEYVVDLTSVDESGLKGRLSVDSEYSEDDEDIKISVIPKFLASKIYKQSFDWKKEDLHSDNLFVDSPFKDGYFRSIPIIDPDIVSFDNIRFFDEEEIENNIQSIWEKRRTFIDQIIIRLEFVDYDETDPEVLRPHKGTDSMYDWMLAADGDGIMYNDGIDEITFTEAWDIASPSEYLKTLYDDLKRRDDLDDQIKLDTDIFLSKDAFIRFFELYIQEELNANDRVEFVNILTQAIKGKYYEPWIKEELRTSPVVYPTGYDRIGVSSIYISQEFFKSNLTEPIEGHWYPLRSKFTINRKVSSSDVEVTILIPFIEPGTMREVDIREGASSEGVDAIISVLNARNEVLIDKIADLSEILDSGKPDIKNRIKHVYTNSATTSDFSPNYNSVTSDDAIEVFEKIYSDLNSNDLEKIEDAQNEIQNLQLSLEDFRFLNTLITRSNLTEPVFTDNEIHSLSLILTKAYKSKNLYNDWVAEEVGDERTYWSVNSHLLSKWRAPQSLRDLWVEALNESISPCAVDHDLVSYDALLDKTYRVMDVSLDSIDHVENMAYFYQGRRQFEEFSLIIAAIKPSIIVDHKIYVRETLTAFNIPIDLILPLYVEGKATKGMLLQANLSLEEFLYLKKIFELTEDASEVSPSDVQDFEWDSFANIIYNVYRKRAYARWKREEQGLAFYDLNEYTSNDTIEYSLEPESIDFDKIVNISPDFFQLPVSIDEFDIDQPLIWRRNESSFRRWHRILKSRISDRQDLIDSYYAMIAEIEDEHLKSIRDALIDCAKVPTVIGGETMIDYFPTAKKKLTDRLLIDLDNNCCQKLTRVSFAIDTIQNLIWQTRTGILLDTYSNLILNADNFDNEWQWLGSYENWRTYMFVYMYPENLLSPSLKKWNSPVFLNLLKLRNIPNVTPQEVTHAYADLNSYVKDLSDLVVSYNFISSSNFYENDKDGKESTYSRYLHYQFGIAPTNGKLYYSYFDIYDNSSFAQSFWRFIDVGVKVNRLIGARVFRNSLKEKFIYVLFISAESNKLFYTRLNMDKKGASWEDNVELKSIGTEYETDYSWSRIETTDDETRMIKVGFNYAGRLSIRVLDAEGKDWDTSIERIVNYGPVNMVGLNVPQLKLLYMCDVATCRDLGLTFIVVQKLNRDVEFYTFKRNDLTSLQKHGDAFKISGFFGAFSYYNNDNQFFIWVQYKIGQSVKAIAVSFGFPVTIKFFLGTITIANPTIDATVYPILGVSRFSNLLTSFLVPAGNRVDYLLVTAGDSKNPGNFLTTLRYNTTSVVVISRKKITPTIATKTALSCVTNGLDLQRKRNDIKSDVLANEGGFRSTMIVIEEAYYFGPIFIAQQLQKSGNYIQALDWFKNVYDYTVAEANRKIYHGLKLEETFAYSFNRMDEWLLDPSNPHNIAATRTHSYSKYTLQNIVKCLIAYADSEFTIDTIETVSRARNLYSTALELLDNPLLASKDPVCNFIQTQLILSTDIPVSYSEKIAQLKTKIASINDVLKRNTLVETVNAIFAGVGSLDTKFANALIAANSTINSATNIADVSSTQANMTNQAVGVYASTSSDANQQNNIKKIALVVNNDFYMAALSMTGVTYSNLIAPEYSAGWTSVPVAFTPTSVGVLGGNFDTYQSLVNSTNTYTSILGGKRISIHYIPNLNYGFCVPANPIPRGLRLKAELNLFKIHNCRNISGMMRELEPYAAATDAISGMPSVGDGGNISITPKRFIRNTDYRYRVVIQRAKELGDMANRLEGALLSMYEKIDAEKYGILKAKQDINTSRETLKLQDLRYQEAESGVTLSQYEKKLSEIQKETYLSWINDDENDFETQMLELYNDIATTQQFANGYRTAAGIANAGMNAADAFSAALKMPIAATVMASLVLEGASNAIAIEKQAFLQRVSFKASHQRRKDEWSLQFEMAKQGEKIGDQKIKMAGQQLQVVGQERNISKLQIDNAEATLTYLQNKFTNADLYEWMSGVIDNIYRYYLNQATALAKMAADQLYFERQLRDIPIIQRNYYTLPNENNGSDDGSTLNRKGLTASSMLLQDITKLEQYAFETDRRKMQLNKTISLAKMNPFEFQEFKATGEINFRTRMEMFDKDFPGHYLRLIKRVRVSIIALVPPVDGIKATLTTVGSSRVVIKGDVFSDEKINRGPESVSLTSPINASGLFEMEQNSPEMLYPFEGVGVDTLWNLTLPIPANTGIDFNTIADVLISIDYTAFEDIDLRVQTVKMLKNENNEGEIFFSFKNNLPDQWYDLNNPESSPNPMSVTFKTTKSDFPASIANIQTGKIKMMFTFDLSAEEIGIKIQNFDNYVKKLYFKSDGTNTFKGGEATSMEGRVLNASAWKFNGKPFGEWIFELPNMEVVKNMIKGGIITDIILVIGFSGDPLKWPSSY